MPYIDETALYAVIEKWRGNNAMYGMTHNSEEELIREIDQLPRVDGRHVMPCDTCRAKCGNYIPLDVGGEG